MTEVGEGDDAERVIDPSSRGGPRWWPLAAGAVLVMAVAWVLATAWTGVLGSHPVGWITLVAAGLAGVVLGAWALLVPPHSGRSPTRTWLLRGGLVVTTAAVVALVVYTRPLSAEQVALDALVDGDGVRVHDSATAVRFEPDAPRRRTGLAFYPGAKVDPRAYARVLRPLAEAGYPVVILKQPFNLAILDGDAADRVVGDPDDDVDRWVVGGHSLGGAMAARYAEDERRELVGLLLYAAYPVDDMSSRSGLAVLSVSGTNDGLADVADIDASVDELPPTARFVRIEGGVHSFFGDYGEQRGDGTPTIERDEAQTAIASASVSFLEAIDSGELPAG